MKKVIYAIRTTVGQESLVVDILANRVQKEGLGIYSVAVIPNLKGYVLIEADNELTVRRSLANMPQIKGRGMVEGEIKIEELSSLLEAKPLMQSIKEGDKAELISGPFKGEKCRILRVNESKEEVTVELLEAAVKIPLTTKAESVRIIKE
ncbi:transcription elongation factor Spt5 [Candidatus Micrarchaeota archaeon]|nr:transcription elongation factor Spt5 [Candidatus Micrarchaeota archaeon]MBU1930029.1 transcription elongation factor Spt5 [Candidatus Micrarchaeota archaeon]